MRFLLWLIAIFALAAGVAMLAGSNDGLVQIILPFWRKQIVLSLNFVIVALLLGFVLGHFLLRLINSTLDLPGRFGLYRSRRQQEKAFNAFKKAVRALFETRYSAAVQYSKQAYKGDAEPVIALVAARAFHGLHDDKRYREWLEKTEKDSEGRMAALLTEAQFALETRRLDEAVIALDKLQETGHHGDLVTKIALEVAMLRNQWDKVPGFVERLAAHKALSAEEARPLMRQAHIGQLRNMIDDAQVQASYWNGLSKTDQTDTELLIAAVPLLAKAGQGALAQKAVERSLDGSWNSDLAALYHLAAGNAGEAASLSKTEEWLKKHPQDAGLLYSAGMQCIASRLWGKAQTYLEDALESRDAPKTRRALAELMDHLGRPKEAIEHYRHAVSPDI